MDPDETRTSTQATLLATAGQNRWPPAGSYMATTGHDLMAADNQGRPSQIHRAQPRHMRDPRQGGS